MSLFNRVRQIHRNCEGLGCIAHVRKVDTVDSMNLPVVALPLEPSFALFAQVPEVAREILLCDPQAMQALHAIVNQVGHQAAKSREHRWQAWYDDTVNATFFR